MHHAGLHRFDLLSHERLDSAETNVRWERLLSDADLWEVHDSYCQLPINTNCAQKYGCA
jgi:hypothetical protein